MYGTKPLSEPIRLNETNFIETLTEIQHFDLALEYVVCKLAAISC